MILAHHVIVTAYGFWLPNDPRGSWSNFVGSWELVRFGKATKTTDRHSLARKPHDRESLQAAKKALKYPPVHFTGLQARAIANGFNRACEDNGYVLHACAVLEEHAHLIIAQHPYDISLIAGHLKGRATQQLKEEGLWPNDGRPVWARKCWKVFLNSVEDVLRAIEYVENNPLKEGNRRQNWSFVKPYVRRFI